MKPGKWLCVMLLLGIWLLLAAKWVLISVRPTAGARVTPGVLLEPPGPPRLARCVLFVVIDGLRWDIATNAQRMPHLSRAIRKHRSAIINAGPVTMTSSAVLAFGTGQRGGLDQVLENLHQPIWNVNDWLANAKGAGLRIMVAGDPAWSQLYGKSLDEYIGDPEGLGIDVDFNHETFRNARHLASKTPDVLVAHFVTPDHQGHAYGVKSPRYAEHIHEFDRQLFAWLDSLDDEWTIVITSDHGAADSGTHGTDTMEQRRCPIVAYGPGIRAPDTVGRELQQTEIPGLLSALLGVANAAESRGSIPFDWLDEPAPSERTLACREVHRLSTLALEPESEEGKAARSLANRCCDGNSSTCAGAAYLWAKLVDRQQSASEMPFSRDHVAWLAAAVAAAAALLFSLHGLRTARPGAFSIIWLGISLGLTYAVERLAGAWPNVIRGALFVVCNALPLTFCVGLARSWAWLHRHPSLVLSVLPGWLVVSYTANTQVEAYVCVVLLGSLGLWRLHRSNKNASHVAAISEVLLAFGAVAVLLLPGTRASDVTPHAFLHGGFAAFCAAAAVLELSLLIVLWKQPFAAFPRARDDVAPSTPHRAMQAQPQVRDAVGASAIVMIAFALRYAPLSWAGRMMVIGLVGATVFALAKRKVFFAFVLCFASTVLLSRNFDCVVLGASLALAALLGAQFPGDSGPTSPFVANSKIWHWGHVTFAFALGYLLWIGQQGGIQLNTFDFTAGAFGDSHLPAWVIALCLVFKFTVAEALLFLVYTGKMQHSYRRRFLTSAATLYVARGVTLLLMLTVCGQSYWTAFRALADLPFALVGVFGVVVVSLFEFFSNSHGHQAT